MTRAVYCILFIIGFAFASCDRVKRKSDKAIEAVKNEAGAVANFVAPKFDSDKPDTKNNKAHFKKFTQVELTPDVKNIYCYGDATGADQKYQFSFECDSSTIGRINKKQGFTLKADSENFSKGKWKKFPWWDEGFIQKTPPYYRVDDNGILMYLWYNRVNKKAYFSVFDL